MLIDLLQVPLPKEEIQELTLSKDKNFPTHKIKNSLIHQQQEVSFESYELKRLKIKIDRGGYL